MACQKKEAEEHQTHAANNKKQDVHLLTSARSALF
jgi:hypothetical protein